MHNVTYINGWDPKLCINLDTIYNDLADFNRFLVKHFPSTKEMKQGNTFEDAKREGLVVQLKAQFQEALEEGSSHSTLSTYYQDTSKYLRWCDTEQFKAFEQASLEGYMTSIYNDVMLGKIKRTTYTQKRARLSTVFIKYLNLPSSWFNHIPVLGKGDTEPFEAYTRSDLNQLLPFLRRLFNQTYQQFIQSPDKHIQASRSYPTMTFSWNGRNYPLCAGISKMMCAATYLLAYYTYSNASDLFQLAQPANASTSASDAWYTMPSFKRRAFKTIQVEMGANDLLEIPKYAISFFDKLLHASRIIRNGENAYLLQTITNKKFVSVSNITLQSFLKHWVEKHFTFTDQTGRRLRPMISRFRETGAQLTTYHQGEIVGGIMLNNTRTTRKQHYSKGNRHVNKGMLQDAMSILQEQIQSNVDTKQAMDNLEIEVLVIEEEYRASIPGLSRTPNGGSCGKPFGEASKKYTKRAYSQNLIKEGERLACADLLRCFGCSEQVIVQSTYDIWCLLSFKGCIEESLYLHLDAHHYRKNFESIITFIDENIIPNIQNKIMNQAKLRLLNDGFHPLWDDSNSILELIPHYVTQEN
ncbi:hypothetical protein [Vibrio crassostreae]|uniref:hypothetical protein n=1 Tax=Vibrio crassostreae TaxID=246167 RepID=UPI001B306CAF|nr:hypothetical protein [Vibrio crassostreae]